MVSPWWVSETAAKTNILRGQTCRHYICLPTMCETEISQCKDGLVMDTKEDQKVKSMGNLRNMMCTDWTRRVEILLSLAGVHQRRCPSEVEVKPKTGRHMQLTPIASLCVHYHAYKTGCKGKVPHLHTGENDTLSFSRNFHSQ